MSAGGAAPGVGDDDEAAGAVVGESQDAAAAGGDATAASDAVEGMEFYRVLFVHRFVRFPVWERIRNAFIDADERKPEIF